jgi:valyl-tRNA synthetase
MEYMPGLYPYVIGDHMFFLKCSKPIPKYDEFIMNSLIQSKRGLEMTNNKLSNPKFIEKAPSDIIELEKRKLEDFGFKWELWTKAYLLYG